MHYEKFQDGTVKCIEDEIPFEVPEGWCWARIRDIAMVKGGKRLPKGASFSEEITTHAYIRVTDMKNHSVNVSNLRYISDEIFSAIKNYTIAKDDLYVTIAGTIGVVGEIPDKLDGMNLTENAVKITNIAINKSFLCIILQTDFVQQQFQDKTHQVAMPKLALERILSTLIPICSSVQQLQIVDRFQICDNFLSTIDAEKEELQKIVSLSKSKILDLAIRGKLVPQDPNDEPASVLLERIRAEKEELIKHGKIKRDKKESVIFKGDDNSYYRQTGNLIEAISDWELDDIPDNWALCCLGELCDYGNCNNVEADSITNNAWILDLEDIEKDTGRVIKKIRKTERDFTSTKHSFHEGQVLYSKLRPYLNKVIIADEDGFCTSEILPLDFLKVVLPQYALYYLMSPTFLKYANRCSYGVKMPRLGTADGKKAIFPLPPLEEQYRISDCISKIFMQVDTISASIL